MPRPQNEIIEYRNYELPTYFPILILSGKEWRISDIPSGRLHFHNCLEIGLCETDSGTMEFMDLKKEFKAGDVTIVGSDIPHTTYSTKGTQSKWSYIFVNVLDLLGSNFYTEMIADSEDMQWLMHSSHDILSTDIHPDVHNIVAELVDCLNKKDTNFQFAARGLMLALLVKLINIHKSEVVESESLHSINSKVLVISPALDYIRKNYMHDFSMKDLADVCHMSSTNFRRTFTNIMGQGPLSYLNLTRIRNADVLLRTTERPILEISESVGFSTVSSFNRHFADFYGMPPLKWRKQTSYIRNQSVLKYTGWMVPPKL